MTATTFNTSAASYFGRPRLLRGVCGEIADRAGVAVWIPRAAFIVFGLLHWFLALLLYVVLVKIMAPARQRWQRRFAPPAQTGPGYTEIHSRFSSLDARLADLEAASLQQEATLRRQFRDLERG